MAYWTSRIILWVIAFIYAYFAFARALNIASMGGFDWTSAPLPWQLLDVIYLAANVAVVYGFVLVRPIGFIGFFFAAFSQIAITVMARPEIGGTAEEIEALSAQAEAYDWRIAFQVVTIILVFAAIWLRRNANRT